MEYAESSTNHWNDFEQGTSIGQLGSEGGSIMADEEHSDGARISLERSTPHAPFAITCGIYGWMVHTCFLEHEAQARAQYNAMKLGIEEILRVLRESYSDQKQVGVVAGPAFDQFIKKFP